MTVNDLSRDNLRYPSLPCKEVPALLVQTKMGDATKAEYIDLECQPVATVFKTYSDRIAVLENAQPSTILTELAKTLDLSQALFNDPITENNGLDAIALFDEGSVLDTTNAVPGLQSDTVKAIEELNAVLKRQGETVPATQAEVDLAAPLFRKVRDYFDQIANSRPIANQYATMHDIGSLAPVTFPNSAIKFPAHLEGGAGYRIDGNALNDGWEAIVTNTTDALQPITLANTQAFFRDGNTVTPVDSPVAVPANISYLLQHTLNGGVSYTQIIPVHEKQAAVDLTSITTRLTTLETNETADDAAFQAFRTTVNAKLATWDYIFIESDMQVQPYSKLMAKNAGTLTLWPNPTNGQWFSVQDASQVLKTHKNKIIAGAGQTIDAANTAIDSNEFILDPEGSSWAADDSLIFVYNETTKDWVIGASGLIQTPIPEVTRADLIAVQNLIAVTAAEETAINNRLTALEARPAGADLTAVTAQLTTIGDRVTTLESTPTPVTLVEEAVINDRLATLEARPVGADLTTVNNQLTNLGSRIATLENTPAPVTTAEEAVINDRLTALEARPTGGDLTAINNQLTTLGDRIATLESTPAPVTAAEEIAYVNRIAALEAKLAEHFYDLGSWLKIFGTSTITDHAYGAWQIQATNALLEYVLPHQISKNTVSLKITAISATASLAVQWFSGGQQFRRPVFNWNGTTWTESGETGSFAPSGKTFSWSYRPAAILDGRDGNVSGLRLIDFSGTIQIERIRFTNA
jgi:cob(I)alamin adenosyltransferase